VFFTIELRALPRISAQVSSIVGSEVSRMNDLHAPLFAVFRSIEAFRDPVEAIIRN